MHLLYPPIVRGATYDASPKRSKGDAEFDGDAKSDATLVTSEVEGEHCNR